MKVEIKGKSPYKGSKSPGIGYLYILVCMFLVIAGAAVMSGGMNPVDPNGPGGPPSLPPYFASSGEADEQQVIWPSNATPNQTQELQLKTFKVNVCSQKAVIDILIDTSQSMQYENKMTILQSSLRTFTKKLTGSAGIGMQTFSADVHAIVPLDYYRNQKQQVAAAIDGLSPDGWTRTRDGFEEAKAAIVGAKQSNKFPGYKYYLILLTDGVPEEPNWKDTDCARIVPESALPGGRRCFNKNQDPTIPTDIAADLKNAGVEIYSIGMYSSSFSSDKLLEPDLKALLNKVASSPNNSHYYGIDQAPNLDKALGNIFTGICNTDISEPTPYPSYTP